MNPETKTTETEATRDNGMITAPAADQAFLSVLRNVFGEQAGRALHNFDGGPKDIWRMTALATGPLSLHYDDLPEGKRINLQYFYVHRITLEVEGGELRDCIRTVLFDKNGKAYAFVSDILARDLAMLLQTFGVSKFDPPLAVQIVKTSGKPGHIFYSIAPV